MEGKGGGQGVVRSEGFLSSPERRGEDSPNLSLTESLFEKIKILKPYLTSHFIETVAQRGKTFTKLTQQASLSNAEAGAQFPSLESPLSVLLI